jgi:hypothetical protein
MIAAFLILTAAVVIAVCAVAIWIDAARGGARLTLMKDCALMLNRLKE